MRAHLFLHSKRASHHSGSSKQRKAQLSPVFELKPRHGIMSWIEKPMICFPLNLMSRLDLGLQEGYSKSLLRILRGFPGPESALIFNWLQEQERVSWWWVGGWVNCLCFQWTIQIFDQTRCWFDKFGIGLLSICHLELENVGFPWSLFSGS